MRVPGGPALGAGSLNGRVAIVTGASGGIGLPTAAALAAAGAHVVLAGRAQPALQDAARSIAAQSPGAEVSTGLLDLADLSSVRAFAAAVSAAHAAVDLLINNAGVMAIPERRLSADGFELTFGTNHLGHFALTGLLLATLLRAPAARVVTVSSLTARWARLDPDNLDARGRYAPLRAYGTSKLANLLFAAELAERAGGTALLSVAVHPGTALTGLQRHGSRRSQALARRWLEPLLGQSPAQAARPTLHAATSPGIANGGLYAPTGRFELRGAPGPVRLPAAALDLDLRQRLWQRSEELTGVRYSFPPAATPSMA